MASAALSSSRPSGAPRDLVFISYSRPDRDWLERLLIFLKPYTRQNLKIWADPYIQVGDEWRRDISTALSRSCVGVLLVSYNFLASDFIDKEELPPLLEGAAAGSILLVPIPISASNYETSPLAEYQFAHPPTRPLDKLRKPERNAAFVEIVKKIVAAARNAAPDLGAQPVHTESASAPLAPIPAVHTPLNINIDPLLPAPQAPILPDDLPTTSDVMLPEEALPAPAAMTGVPAMLHGVPGQRPHHLSRPEFLAALKQEVLNGIDRAVGITGTKPAGGDARIGLHGMGGIGKTVLAIDLVNDDEVRRAFPDGIFWLTLGQTIEPLRLQGELAGYIAGETAAYATVNEARDQLRQLFDEKACLLVLDDVWQPQDAEPFNVLGPRSRLLLTTRDADLLVALGARELPLDVLSEELALELLASWARQAPGSLPAAARKVAENCGYLPLALALAGARVQSGASWDEVFSALELGRLEFLDHPYGSIFKSLRLGTDALTEFDRNRYFELAVFPEDADIPIDAICTLWRHTGGMKPYASQDLLRRLHRRALLTRHSDGAGVSFHDLQHDFLRLNIGSLVEAHATLVNAYRAVAVSGWASGPDDGYFFRHLPQHLAGADRLNEIKALLYDYDWLAAKLRATNVNAILADYDLVVQDRDLILIQQALRLSIPALLRDPSQLPGQLLGRLQGADSPAVKALVTGAGKGPGRAWLCPRFAALTPPGGPLRQILVGHTGSIEAVAVLADGSRALSGSSDKTLRLWDLATGETLRTLEGHTHSVSAVAVLADGSRAVSGSYDNTIRLWDLTTSETLRTLEGHTGWVSAVAMLADGSRALSGSYDNTLRLWDLTTGETLRTLEGHTHSVHAVAMSADGSRALSGSSDNTLRLWELATGETLRTLEGHTSWVSAIAVLPDGSRALSGSDDDTLRLWDLTTGKTLRILEGHAGWVSAVTVRADGNHALSGSSDNTLRVWDLTTGETLRTLEGHTDSVRAVAMLADGSRALSGSSDNTLRLWDLATGETQRAPEGHMDFISAVAVLADGSRALSGSHDNTLRLWDLATGETLRILKGHTRPVNAVAVLGDGSRALSGSDDNTLRLWDLATGETLHTLEGHTHSVRAVAVLADGNRALSGSWDNTVRLWDLNTGKTLCTLKGHKASITAMALLADGCCALSSSDDNTLRLWDLATGEVLQTFERPTSVRLADGSHADTLEWHTLSDSPALFGSGDNMLRFWCRAIGECLEFVADAAFTCLAVAREDLIVAGTVDGKIHILEIRQQ
jgi:WD40 repeat protein